MSLRIKDVVISQVNSLIVVNRGCSEQDLVEKHVVMNRGRSEQDLVEKHNEFTGLVNMD